MCGYDFIELTYGTPVSPPAKRVKGSTGLGILSAQ